MSTTTDKTIVIVGGGLAAGKAVQGVRDDGFDGRIVVFGEEAQPPYERPPLSKGYLMGKEQFASARVHSPEWYAEHNVDLRMGTRVTGIDPVRHTVTAGHQQHRYDKLLISTGATPRRLHMADRSGAPMTYLRTVEDSDRIRSMLHPGSRLAIIGGGWIGLEVAAAARDAGADVTVLETHQLPLMHVLGPEVARIFATLHQEHGVDLRVNTQPVAIEGSRGHAVVHLAGGSSVEADLVVVGIGVIPNTGLAEGAGLEVDNGIVVDQRLRTSAPDIFAAGDVANAYHPVLDRYLRVEHWDNAIGQGLVAAQSMLDKPATYDRLPYFFSDQYDLGMEYLGNVGPNGYERVVLRGRPDDLTFTAFWLRGSQVVAAMHANDWDAMAPIRQIVGTDHRVDRLTDESLPLADLVTKAA